MSGKSENLHPGLNLGVGHGSDHEGAEAAVFGFWVFLMSDLITFGVLFATYAASNTMMGRAAGPGPADLFDLTSIAWQTGLLLLSSMTCGFSALALKYKEGRGRVVLWLGVTALLGLGFLVLELRDFADMIAKDGTPMRSGWLSSFYALVGLHGLHITAGLVWAGVMMVMIGRRGDTHHDKRLLLMFGLYWHFLDLVWIGIFSVVFLGGLA